MATFKRTQRVQWAKPRAVNNFVDEVITGMEQDKLTHAQALALANTIVEDASSGELKLDGCNVYAVTILKAFRTVGLDIPKDETSETPATAASKYRK